MRSKAYLGLLVLAVVLGVPIAVLAYGFLKLTTLLQHWTFASLPQALGLHGAPPWWALVPVAAAGLLTGLSIRFLPGHGGESPVAGFSGGRLTSRDKLPGILCAALA